MLRCLLSLLLLSPVACSAKAPAQNAEPAPLVIDQRVGEPCISKKDPVAVVICDTELRVADARERRDVVRLLCYDDKLSRIRELAAMREKAREKLAADPVPPAGEAKHLRQLVAVTEEHIQNAWNALDACISEYPAPTEQPASRSFSPPGTAGTEHLRHVPHVPQMPQQDTP